MSSVLEGQVLINGTDIWKEFSVFLTEERKGGRENLNAILAPSKTKGHTAVDFREKNGEKYSKKLIVASEARDITLHFALYADSQKEWLEKYVAFIQFLKTGKDGWLDVNFPGLNLTLRVFYTESSSFRSITYLWKEGKQAGAFKIKFREPDPKF